MSGLIITLISIALIAVTALAAMYFGGDAFREGGDKADFAHLQNEANQIVIAGQLYMAEHAGKSPDNVQELVDKSYLKNKPTVLVDKLELNGSDVPVEWEFGFENFVTQLVKSEDKCAKLNGIAGGGDDIANIPSCSTEYDRDFPCCKF